MTRKSLEDAYKSGFNLLLIPESDWGILPDRFERKEPSRHAISGMLNKSDVLPIPTESDTSTQDVD